MATSFQAKQAMVAEVSDVAARAHSAVLAEYRGLNAGQMDRLRSEARHNGAYVKVIKNNLAKLAIQDTDYACMHDAFEGPVILGFSLDDPGAAARVISNFRKEHGVLNVTAVSFNGQLLSGEHVDRLAKLPTRDEALSQLMRAMMAPLDKLARTTREPVAKFARATAAVRDHKQAA